MSGVSAIALREAAAMAARPRNYVVAAVFVVVAGLTSIFAGGFFRHQRADLDAFFAFLPWLLALFAPVLSIGRWSDEMRSLRIDFLLSLPNGIGAFVVAKFLAAWALGGAALVATMGFWLAAGALGHPDHGAIASGYFGAFLALGALVAASGVFAAMSARPILPYAAGLATTLFLTAIAAPGAPDLLAGYIGVPATHFLGQLGYWPGLESARLGVVEGPFVFWAATTILAGLTLTGLFIARRRGG